MNVAREQMARAVLERAQPPSDAAPPVGMLGRVGRVGQRDEAQADRLETDARGDAARRHAGIAGALDVS